MSQTNGNGHEPPASPLLICLIEEVTRSHQMRLEQILQIAKREAGYPPTARFSMERMVWLLPSEP